MSSCAPGPLHIVLVSSSLGGGGAERVLLTMAEYWAGQGRAVTIVTLRRDPPTEYAIPEGVVLKRLNLIAESNPFWSPAHVFSLIRLRRELVRLRPDVVISFIDKLNVAVIFALTASKIPMVATEHLAPWMNPLGMMWERARRYAYARAFRVVSPTQAITDWFSTRVKGRFVTLPYPACLETFDLYTGRDRLVIGVGRLVAQKGFDLLIRAFSLLGDDATGWELKIAGEGPARRELLQLIQLTGQSSKVQLMGHVEDVAALFRQAEVFVLPSRHEAYPMVLCEAIGAGCAILAADCPTGPREILGNSGAGMLVPVGDSAALANGLRALLTNDKLREELRGAALLSAPALSSQAVMQEWDRSLSRWLPSVA